MIFKSALSENKSSSSNFSAGILNVILTVHLQSACVALFDVEKNIPFSFHIIFQDSRIFCAFSGVV
jgi:hypothetical protein